MINLYRFARLYELELKIEYDNNYDEIVVKFTTKYGNEYIHRIQSYELDSAESEKKMQQLICDWCTEELRLNRKLLKLVNNEKVKKEDINFILLERGLEINGYGLDFTDLSKKTFGDWDNTFHNQLDEAIEQNREELEEEHRGGHLRLIGVEALRVDDRRGEQHAQKRTRSKQQHHERKQIRSVFVAGTLPQLLLHRNVHRQKRGDDHAAADQLVELVGKIVRHLIGA